MKKLVLIGLFLLWGCGQSIPTSPRMVSLERWEGNHPQEELAPMRGDVDGDRDVDVFDLGWLIECVGPKHNCHIVAENSDINCDGAVNIDDFWAMWAYFETFPGDICPSNVEIPCQ